MNQEQEFFISVLADHILFRKSLEPDEISWEQVCEYAKLHQVEGIIYYQCKDFIPGEYAKSLKVAYWASISAYANRISILKRIDAAFSKEKIPYVLFKGTEIAAHYPIPALRTMGDCDILVRSQDKEHARNCLINLGFIGGEREETEWHFSVSGFQFEIHHRLLYDEAVNTSVDQSFCDEVWDYAKPDPDAPLSSRCVLDVNFHFVYILLHLKKHILYKGAGFRQFMDVVIWRKSAGLDMQQVDTMLRKVDLIRFDQVCSELCNRWFFSGSDKKVFESGFFEDSTRKILADGVFGFYNEENENSRVLNSVRVCGKFRTIFVSLFPSYQHCRFIPYYAFVDGRPYLMPVVWIYRFYRAIRFRKLGTAKQEAFFALNSDKAAQKREEKLKQWGI